MIMAMMMTLMIILMINNYDNDEYDMMRIVVSGDFMYLIMFNIEPLHVK